MRGGPAGAPPSPDREPRVDGRKLRDRAHRGPWARRVLEGARGAGAQRSPRSSIPVESELRAARRHHGRPVPCPRPLGRRHGLRPPGPARGDSPAVCKGIGGVRGRAGQAYEETCIGLPASREQRVLRPDEHLHRHVDRSRSRKLQHHLAEGRRCLPGGEGSRPPLPVRPLLARLRSRLDRIRARGEDGRQKLLHADAADRACLPGHVLPDHRPPPLGHLLGARARVRRSRRGSVLRRRASARSRLSGMDEPHRPAAPHRRPRHHQHRRRRPLHRPDLRRGSRETALRHRRGE